MLVLLIANLIILPVTISFFNDDFSPRWVVFYVGSDAVLLLDVLVNFRTGLSSAPFTRSLTHATEGSGGSWALLGFGKEGGFVRGTEVPRWGPGQSAGRECGKL